MYNQYRSPTGTHSFTAKLDGRYNYCFSNEMSTVSPKTVSSVYLLPSFASSGGLAGLQLD